MTSSALPWRLSEKAFRKHEKTIARAIESSPEPVLITAVEGSLLAYESRLRDAVTAYVKYGQLWPVEFSRGKFLDLHSIGRMKVGNKDGIVWIGTRPKDEVVPTDLITEQRLSIDIGSATHENLKFLCLLATLRALSHPIKTAKASDEIINQLQQNYDVRIDDNGDGTMTII